MEGVYVIGVGMHAFVRAGVHVEDMAFDAALAALHDADIEYPEVDEAFIGHVLSYGEHGFNTIAVDVAKDLGLTGAPVNRIDGASASGLVAFREAAYSVAAGRARVALALGFDSRNDAQLPDPDGLSVKAALMPAAFFGMLAVRRMHEVGTTMETYAEIAAKNWNHARLNPYASRRADHEVTAAEILASRMVAYPHTSMMSAAVACGAAAALVADRDTAVRVSERTGKPLIRVLASSLRSEEYHPGHVFLGAIVGPPELTRKTAAIAYQEAGLGPADLDLVHVHDAFPVEELIYAELLGICGDGEADALVAAGDMKLGGRIPFSTDGGLIARGHPGGPTGLAQIHEICTQLRGGAGPRQVENARTGLAHLLGAGSICTVTILNRE